MVAINILIGDRSYRIRINPADEEPVRKAVKLINEKVVEFKTEFAGKDMQDYIAMVLVWFATRQTENAVASDDEEVGKQLKALETALDKALHP